MIWSRARRQYMYISGTVLWLHSIVAQSCKQVTGLVYQIWLHLTEFSTKLLCHDTLLLLDYVSL